MGATYASPIVRPCKKYFTAAASLLFERHARLRGGFAVRLDDADAARAVIE